MATTDTIECEARLFFTEGPALACNLRNKIAAASLLSGPAEVINHEPTPEEKPSVGLPRMMLTDCPEECCREREAAYRCAFGLLAERIVSPDFLDSSKNASYMPFSNEGIQKQIMKEMNAVAHTLDAEVERLAKDIFANEYENALTQAAKAKARVVCSISGYDPYPNQRGGPEFAVAVAAAKEEPVIIEEATKKATECCDAWRGDRRDPRIASLVELMVRVRRRFDNDMKKAMEVLYAQCQEITHVSWALTKMNGEECTYGWRGLKRAADTDEHCPSVYHQSRDVAYALAVEMMGDGSLDSLLGLSGSSFSLAVPGMPPFYFGDVTPGIDYAPDSSDYGIAMNQGNQNNDTGVHASLWNRRDGAGLAVSNEPYMVPMMDCVKHMALEAEAGRPYLLKDGTEVPATISFTCDRSCIKLLQGQKRNDHLVGGDRYLGLALDAATVSLIQHFQQTLMPPSFLLDASFSPHLSIAMLSPSWCPHFKSPAKLAQVADLKRRGMAVTNYYKDHISAYDTFRSAWTPSSTAWDIYEEAASKMPGCKFNHLLVETLGFKTVIASPNVAAADALSSTVYNGACAPPALRALGMDTSVVRWGDGGIRTFGIETTSGEAISSMMTAETYRRLRMPDSEQDAMVENGRNIMLASPASP